jgi:hypothetical protein
MICHGTGLLERFSQINVVETLEGEVHEVRLRRLDFRGRRKNSVDVERSSQTSMAIPRLTGFWIHTKLLEKVSALSRLAS